MFKHFKANLRSIRMVQVIRVKNWSSKQLEEQQEVSQGQQQSTVGYRA